MVREASRVLLGIAIDRCVHSGTRRGVNARMAAGLRPRSCVALLWVAALLVACGGAAPAPVAPPGPTPCARASDAMVQTLLAGLATQDAPPTERADALRNLIRERCERDAWSGEATRCLIAMRRVADAEPCARLLTEAQQAALVRDQESWLGGARRAEPAGDPNAKKSQGESASP